MSRSRAFLQLSLLCVSQSVNGCPSPTDAAWQIGEITERRQAEGYGFEIAGKISATELAAIVDLIILTSLQDIKFVTIFSPVTADVLTCHPTNDAGGCHSYHLARLEGTWTICDESRIFTSHPTGTSAEATSDVTDPGDRGSAASSEE